MEEFMKNYIKPIMRWKNRIILKVLIGAAFISNAHPVANAQTDNNSIVEDVKVSDSLNLLFTIVKSNLSNFFNQDFTNELITALYKEKCFIEGIGIIKNIELFRAKLYAMLPTIINKTNETFLSLFSPNQDLLAQENLTSISFNKKEYLNKLRDTLETHIRTLIKHFFDNEETLKSSLQLFYPSLPDPNILLEKLITILIESLDTHLEANDLKILDKVLSAKATQVTINCFANRLLKTNVSELIAGYATL